jgi:hypothetical protein
MTDSELIEYLRTALDEEAAGLRVLPGAALRARSRGRRRRAARGLFVGLPAVAVAAGLAVGVQSGPPSQKPSVTADYVTIHAEAALDRADGYIERTTQQFPGGSVTTLRDPQTSAMQQTVMVGARVTVCWSTPSGTGAQGAALWHNTCVDHVLRGWWEQIGREPGTVAEQAAGDTPLLTPQSDPVQIETALKTGQVEITGRGQIAGRAAFLLQVTAPEGGVTLLWIDGQTFQPVHMKLPDGDAGAPPEPAATDPAADPGGGLDVVWLPKTSSLLAEVDTPQIPAGYTRVEGPLGF